MVGKDGNRGGRCLVPAAAFSEPDQNTSKPVINRWFRRADGLPFFFAGVWREWEGTRGTNAEPATGKHLLFSFLTTDASPDVAPIHPDATPVLLLDETARETWMSAPVDTALALQRPPPAGALKIVATDTKQDI